MISVSRFCHIPSERVSIAHEVGISADYKVFVNGREVSVYTCRISEYPFNRLWPGFQRPVNQTEVVSFVNLVADEAVEIEVQPLKKSLDGNVMVKPASKRITPERVGDRVRFPLADNGGYVFEIDDYHGLLYLFHNKPVPCDDPASVTHYFGPGVHFPGKIVLHSDESVYVDKDALVYGCIYAENAENIRIFGNGIFDDSGEARYTEFWYDSYVNGNLKFYDCKNLRVEGVGFVNSAMWCVNVFHCFDVVLDGINVFGQWRYNTDGVDIVNSRRVTLKNSFIHSFDDTVVIKGVDRYAYENCSDIRTENCVLWCDWGKTCELGFETAAPEYERIVFRNCDVLRGGNTLCYIANGDCAYIHDVIFEDLRLELEPAYTPEIVQRSEEQVYTGVGETAIARILSIHNVRFREKYAFMGLPEAESEIPLGDPRYAGVRDVQVRKIDLICPPALAEKMGKGIAQILIRKAIPTTEFKNITVEQIRLNGAELHREDMTVACEGCGEDLLTIR